MKFTLSWLRDRLETEALNAVAVVALSKGIYRIAMREYGIPYLHAFFESDLRWPRYYGFAGFDMPDLAGG